MDIIKEVCVDNITDAINAVKFGADRIEFCSKLDEDGLTPKTEDLISIKKIVSCPIRVMVRPHSKSFIYSEQDLNEMKKTIAIIDSMTPKERENHNILDGSRRRRIAQGSGTAVQDINSLIKKFLQMKKMSKNMGKLKKNSKNLLNFS